MLGSYIQILSIGGPYPDANIEFTVENENILGMRSINKRDSNELGVIFFIRAEGTLASSSMKDILQHYNINFNAIFV